MKILFTKTSIEREVSEYLGADYACEFKDFIALQTLRVPSFFLGEHALIFTSKNGVLSFLENGFQPQQEVNKILVVGKKSEALLREKGFSVYKTFSNAQELSDFIIKTEQKGAYLHFCGNLSLEIIPEKSLGTNLSYRQIRVYTTHLLYPKISKNYDAIVFFSPSGVRSFVASNSLAEALLFSIGETTEKEIRKYTQTPVVSSSQNSLKELINLISSHLKKK